MKRFKHNGNLGDIIYSLPTIIALGGGTLYIGNGTNNLGIPEKARPYPMTANMVDQIIELLKLQPYLLDVRPYNNEDVDFNLDKFRESRFLLTTHLAAVHLKTFGVKFNLGYSWLENIDPYYVSEIIINRSERHLSKDNIFNWRALRGYEDRCLFVGFEHEYVKFKEYTGLSIKRYSARSILDLARIIKGSKLFIGNQSLCFALAEGMKQPRVLEGSYTFRNCMPQSMNGFTRLNKGLLRNLLNKKKLFYINPLFDNYLANIRNNIDLLLERIDRRIKSSYKVHII